MAQWTQALADVNSKYLIRTQKKEISESQHRAISVALYVTQRVKEEDIDGPY